MKRLEDQLTTLAKPSVDLPLHRARLRRVLLNSTSDRFEGFTSFTMSFTKLLPASLALFLLFGLVFTFRAEQASDFIAYIAPDASAEELVNGSIERLQALTSEELEELASERGFTVDGLFKDLGEASVAPDLDLLTMNPISCDDVDAQSQILNIMGFLGSDVIFTQNEDGTESPKADTPCAAYTVHLEADQTSSVGYDFGFTFQGAQEISNAQGLTAVHYTDADGNRVVLLLSEDLIPYTGIRFSQGELTMTFGG